MKLTHDPYAYALYLVFSDNKVKSTQMLNPDMIIDLGANKQAVGMEILSVSKKVPKKALGSLQFELITEKPKPALVS